MVRADPIASSFRRAVESADAGELRRLFSEHPELAEVVDEPWFSFDSPAIVHAAGMRDRDLLDALIDLGADVAARSSWEAGPYSALHRLVDGATPASLELAEHLVERGVPVDLHAAAGLGRLELLADILDAEPERVGEPGPDGATPLHLASDPEVASFLLERGAEIDTRCVDHNSTPAMWAVQGRSEVTRFLVERGAKADLFMAAVLDDADLARRILAEEPGAIDARVRFGASHEHVGFGDKYVWALEGAGTPLEVARVRGHSAVYALLLERSTPAARLVQASKRADVDEVARLLSAHSELLTGLSDDDLCRALYGSAAAAALLLERGADPNARDEVSGATPLHHACWRDERELIELLLEHGADAHARDRSHDSTPLGWADFNGQREVVSLLVERFPPDLVDAAWLGLTDRVEAILDEDPTLVDGIDHGRVSPLRTAAYYGRVDVIRALLARGADRSIPSPESGRTALELALEQGHTEVSELLAP